MVDIANVVRRYAGNLLAPSTDDTRVGEAAAAATGGHAERPLPNNAGPEPHGLARNLGARLALRIRNGVNSNALQRGRRDPDASNNSGLGSVEGQPRAGTQNLATMPGDVHYHLAKFLDARSVVDLSQTSRRIRAELGDAAVAAQWLTRAWEVTSPAGVQGALRDLRADLSESPALMAEPMTVLARGIYNIRDNLDPAASRQMAWTSIFNAHTDVPREHRAPVLTTLAGALRMLPNNARQAAWTSIFNARTGVPPEHQAPALTALVGAIGDLPEDVRQAEWAKVFAAHADLPPEHRARVLTALSGAVGHLPEEVRPAAWTQVFDAHTNVLQQDCAPILTALVGAVRGLPEGMRPAAWTKVYEAHKDVRPEDQAPVLAALSNLVMDLPENAREAAWTCVLEAQNAMPPEHRASVLTALAPTCALRQSQPEQEAAWTNMFHAYNTLPREHQPLVLAALVDGAEQLPFRHSVAGAWVTAWHALQTLPNDYQASILGQLKRIIHHLPRAHRDEAEYKVAIVERRLRAEYRASRGAGDTTASRLFFRRR